MIGVAMVFILLVFVVAIWAMYRIDAVEERLDKLEKKDV